MKKSFKYKRTKLWATVLKIDRAYQRDVVEAHMNRIAREMDLDSLRTFAVSDRGAGEYFVIDGQHRLLALKKIDCLEYEVDVDLYSDLTVEDEAALYLRLNAARVLTTWNKYKAAIEANDLEALTIKDICGRNSLEPAARGGPGKIRCVAALQRVLKLWGPETLDNALSQLVSIWGNIPDAVDAHLVLAVAQIDRFAGDTIDWDNFRSVLAKMPGGPRAVIGAAGGLKQGFRTRSSMWLCAKIMIERYNQCKRANRLDWENLTS